MTSQRRVASATVPIVLALAAGTISCGGGGASSPAPPPPPPAIKVSISPNAANGQWGGSIQLTATVENDGSNRGVTWTITCSSTPCGSLSSTSTASGKPTTYSPPVALPAALSPRLIVTDPSAEILGVYAPDGQVSTARKKVGNFESIFSGEYGFTNGGDWPPDPLRALLQTTGVHIWSTAGDTIHTDGNLLVIHAANAGPDTISLPTGITATPLGGGAPSTGTLNLNFSRVGETQWFQLSPPAGLAARDRHSPKRK